MAPPNASPTAPGHVVAARVRGCQHRVVGEGRVDHGDRRARRGGAILTDRTTGRRGTLTGSRGDAVVLKDRVRHQDRPEDLCDRAAKRHDVGGGRVVPAGDDEVVQREQPQRLGEHPLARAGLADGGRRTRRCRDGQWRNAVAELASARAGQRVGPTRLQVDLVAARAGRGGQRGAQRTRTTIRCRVRRRGQRLRRDRRRPEHDDPRRRERGRDHEAHNQTRPQRSPSPCRNAVPETTADATSPIKRDPHGMTEPLASPIH